MDSYKVGGIDVHKKMLAVVITDAARAGEFHFERRKFGTLDSDLKQLSEYLAGHGVQEVVMESTAQYWKPVWRQLEGQCKLHLAQAQSNRAPKGRKRDFQDAERLARRHIAGELILSFVPGPEQRLWRTITRSKHQLTEDKVRLNNQLEALLEDSRIKLSSCVSDLLGWSSRRMLRAMANGERDPQALAKLADKALRATPEQLADAMAAASQLSALQRRILGLFLDRLELIEQQIGILDQDLANALQQHHRAVLRLTEVPGYGVDSAQQVIAEIGPQAATFSSPGELASWVGCCPGREESAEVSKSNRSPKGNWQMRRVLTQVANAAVKTRGSIFQRLYRRLVVKKGHNKALWAVAHRLCRLTWKILHQAVRYQERGAYPDPKLVAQRTSKLVRHLKQLGYAVHLTPAVGVTPTVTTAQ
jgi:transposase